MKYHGNYCGPNWSAGRRQGSVRGSRVPAVDEFDSTCKDHDAVYAGATSNEERNKADAEFFRQNIGRGVKRSLAALAVGVQKKLRTSVGYDLSGPLLGKRKAPETLDDKIAKSAKTSSFPAKDMAIKRVGKRRPVKKPKKRVMRKRKTKAKKRVMKRTFKKGKRMARRKTSSIYSTGVVAKYETGGSVGAAAGQALYIGHAAVGKRIVDMTYRALVKSLFAKAGIHWQDWSEYVLGTTGAFANAPYFRIKYVYRLKQTHTAAATVGFVQYDLTIGTGPDWIKVADDLRDALATAIVVSPDNIGNTQLLQLSLHQNAADDGSSACLANLMIDRELQIEVAVNSVMTICNRSKNESGNTSTDTVDQTVLTGKLYKQRKQWLNGFEMKGILRAAEPNSVPLYGDKATGLISTNSNDTGITKLKKPPAGWQLGATSRNVIIPSGGYLTDKMLFKAKLGVNTLMEKLWMFFFDPAEEDTHQPLKFGYASMFGLESFLNDRIGTNTLEVAFELNQFVTAKLLKPKPVRTAAIVDLDDAL